MVIFSGIKLEYSGNIDKKDAEINENDKIVFSCTSENDVSFFYPTISDNVRYIL